MHTCFFTIFVSVEYSLIHLILAISQKLTN